MAWPATRTMINVFATICMLLLQMTCLLILKHNFDVINVLLWPLAWVVRLTGKATPRRLLLVVTLVGDMHDVSHTCSPRRKGAERERQHRGTSCCTLQLCLATVYRVLPSRQMSSIVLRPSSHTVPLQRRFCRLFSAHSITYGRFLWQTFCISNFYLSCKMSKRKKNTIHIGFSRTYKFYAGPTT